MSTKPLTSEMTERLATYSEQGKRIALLMWGKQGYDVPGAPQPKEKPQKQKKEKAPSNGLTEEQAIVKFACVHRGEKLGEHVCKHCFGKRVHTIFACEIHGACTARGNGGAKRDGKAVAFCPGCEEITAPSGGPVLVPLELDVRPPP